MTQISAICTDIVTHSAFTDNLGITVYHRFQSLSDHGDGLAYPIYAYVSVCDWCIVATSFENTFLRHSVYAKSI